MARESNLARLFDSAAWTLSVFRLTMCFYNGPRKEADNANRVKKVLI